MPVVPEEERGRGNDRRQNAARAKRHQRWKEGWRREKAVISQSGYCPLRKWWKTEEFVGRIEANAIDWSWLKPVSATWTPPTPAQEWGRKERKTWFKKKILKLLQSTSIFSLINGPTSWSGWWGGGGAREAPAMVTPGVNLWTFVMNLHIIALSVLSDMWAWKKVCTDAQKWPIRPFHFGQR